MRTFRILITGFLSMALVLMVLASCARANEPRLLLIGSSNNLTYLALVRLGYQPTVVEPTEQALRQVNPFDYPVIISGFDVRRDILVSSGLAERLVKAIEYGGVFVGFRDWGGRDEWLPSPVKKDAPYTPGQILMHSHPILNDPHKLDMGIIRRVHGGSMYDAFTKLGPGWVPILSGERVQPWFEGKPAFPQEEHYGLIELPHGRGRIILCQLIPEYSWINDDKWSDGSAGKLLLENIMRYALNLAGGRLMYGELSRVPDSYVDSLVRILDVLNTDGYPSMNLSEWKADTEGDFSISWDDRDIITIRHPDIPSQAGAYGTVRRTFPLSLSATGRTLLAFYMTDDYRGGSDLQFAGDRVQTSVENRKEGFRFVEVAVDGTTVWKKDVLGPGGYDWQDNFYVVDITDRIKGKDSVEVALSVKDVKPSQEPFYTDVFLSRVRLFEGIPARKGEGSLQAPGDGKFMPIVEVTDGPGCRSTLLISKGNEELFSVKLTADDLRSHFVRGPVIDLSAGETIEVSLLKDGEGQEAVGNVYLIPSSILAKETGPKPVDIAAWFASSEPVKRVSMVVKGARILAPVTQGVPFGKGQLFPAGLERLRLLDSEGREVDFQAKVLSFWPDGSVKWVLLTFQALPGEYSLLVTEGKGSGPTKEFPPLIRPEGAAYTIDTGRLRFQFNPQSSSLIGAVMLDGRPLPFRSADFTITYRDGTRLSFARARVKESKILENGPQRALLWVRGNYLNGDREDLEFTLQVYVYRNQPFVSVEYTFTNRLATPKVELTDIRFTLQTHQLLLGWVDPGTAPALAEYLKQPHLAVVDPQYVCTTGALGIVAPVAPWGAISLGRVYENSVERVYYNYMAKRDARREYGMQNFGDDTFEWGYGPVYTFWSNQEYDHQFGFLLQYLRSGDERFWQIGDQAASHYRDVDVIHYSSDPKNLGAPRAHNTKHVVEDGWYSDHNLGGISVTHAWVEGLWLHYLLTGDELTREAAQAASDWFVGEVERNHWGAGGPERGPGWTLIALVGAYRATSDEKYLRAAQKVARDVFEHQDPVRGVYSVPISERPSYEGGTSFMAGILGRGLAHLYVETGDVRAAYAVARLYGWLTREARTDSSFFYKQAPGWRNPTQDNQVTSLLAYGFALSERASDWPMVLSAMKLEADVRSLAWMPEVVAILDKVAARIRGR